MAKAKKKPTLSLAARLGAVEAAIYSQRFLAPVNEALEQFSGHVLARVDALDEAICPRVAARLTALERQALTAATTDGIFARLENLENSDQQKAAAVRALQEFGQRFAAFEGLVKQLDKFHGLQHLENREVFRRLQILSEDAVRGAKAAVNLEQRIEKIETAPISAQLKDTNPVRDQSYGRDKDTQTVGTSTPGSKAVSEQARWSITQGIKKEFGIVFAPDSLTKLIQIIERA